MLKTLDKFFFMAYNLHVIKQEGNPGGKSRRMTKQEQIEEMAKDIVRIAGLDVYGKAEELVNLGYRKLPEDSVVLSREEYKRLEVEE